MTGPIRIQRSRARGWRMPPNTVCVTRPGPWGNPYTIAKAREAGFEGSDAKLACMCAGMFRSACESYLPVVQHILRDISALRGKNLACWCALDRACHGDTLLRLANADHIPDVSKMVDE